MQKRMTFPLINYKRGSTRVEGLEKLTEKLLQCLTLETISAR